MRRYRLLQTVCIARSIHNDDGDTSGYSPPIAMVIPKGVVVFANAADFVFNGFYRPENDRYRIVLFELDDVENPELFEFIPEK